MANDSLPTNVRTINLSQGKVALVDVEDYERVIQFKWSALRVERKGRVLGFYAFRTVWLNATPQRKQRRIMLHRFILSAPDGVHVDHKNRNGLDCRRTNLRLATRSQNIWNRIVPIGNAGYRGVFRRDRNRIRPFSASIRCYNNITYLGAFTNAEDAARAYDRAARELHGEFAVLNFPDEKYD